MRKKEMRCMTGAALCGIISIKQEVEVLPSGGAAKIESAKGRCCNKVAYPHYLCS
jgi:hypothetical protein